MFKQREEKKEQNEIRKEKQLSMKLENDRVRGQNRPKK